MTSSPLSYELHFFEKRNSLPIYSGTLVPAIKPVKRAISRPSGAASAPMVAQKGPPHPIETDPSTVTEDRIKPDGLTHTAGPSL